MELEGTTAVVTGGASGMGAEVAQRLTKAGARAVTWDVKENADIVCDVSDPAAVDAAIAKTLEIAGVPTVMAACAGIGHSGALLDVPVDEWDRVMNINLKGMWLATRAVARAMIDAGKGGSIVAVSSVSARLVDRVMGPYCASKAGLDMIVKIAAYEWAAHGIRVNAVGPGVTDTPMLGNASLVPGWIDDVVDRTPLGRLGTAGDIAEAIMALFGLDWVTGQIVLVDGGLALYSPIDSFGSRERAGML